METYFRTQDETLSAANKAQTENHDTHVRESYFICECGESLSYDLIDSKTLNILEEFVYCEACCNHN